MRDNSSAIDTGVVVEELDDQEDQRRDEESRTDVADSVEVETFLVLDYSYTRPKVSGRGVVFPNLPNKSVSVGWDHNKDVANYESIEEFKRITPDEYDVEFM